MLSFVLYIFDYANISCANVAVKMSKYCKRWNVPVPVHLDKLLVEYIDKDSYKTKSEFIRAAVRDKLEQEHQKLEDQP